MKKILLVNHQEAFLDRNKSLLNRAGFLILTATSVQEALDACRQQPVDLIISQLDMPDLGGDQLCSQIRQEDELKQVSIILVCYDSETELERASNCGANAVVTKPIRPDILLKQVSKFLGIQARRDYRVTFDAKVQGTRGVVAFSGMTRNISSSGLLCESELPLKPDDHLSNLLFLLGTDPIITDGTVIWSSVTPDGRCKYGVRFVGLSHQLRERIAHFVESPRELTGCHPVS